MGRYRYRKGFDQYTKGMAQIRSFYRKNKSNLATSILVSSFITFPHTHILTNTHASCVFVFVSVSMCCVTCTVDGHTCLRVDGTGGLCDASAVLAFVPDAALNNQQRHKRHDGSQSRRDTNGKETNHGSEYDNGHSEIEVEDVMDGFGFLVAPFWGSVGPPDGSHSLVEFRKTGKGHGGMDSDGAGKGRGSQGPIEQRVVNDSENTAQPYTATQGARNSLATASAQEAIVPAQATDKLHPRLVTKKGAMSYLAKITGCFINATGRTQRQSRSLMPFLDKYFRYDPNKNGSWGFGTSNDHERWVATLARTRYCDCDSMSVFSLLCELFVFVGMQGGLMCADV